MDQDIEIYRERLKNTLNEKRYVHSLNVSFLAGEMAAFWHLDHNKAVTAGLLHDVARSLTLDQMVIMAKETNLNLDHDYFKEPILLHAPLGAYILEKDWGICDKEILDAVYGHTLADEFMKPLTMVVFLADMLEPTRNWEGIEELRALIFQDLDKSMLKAIESQVCWLKEEDKHIHPSIYRAYKYFLHRVKEKNNRRITLESKDLLLKCVELAKEKKALDIISMELKGLTIICDYFLLMSAQNTRQSQAIADHLVEETKKIDFPPLRVEGHREGDWILIDFGGLIVHVFLEEQRKYYNLERLWGDAPKIEY